MPKADEYDVGVYEGYLVSSLKRYLPHIRKWYDEYYEHTFQDTGAYEITGKDVPPGLYARFSISSNNSAIKGVQAFTFVSISALNLPSAKGGVRNMVRAIIGPDWYELDDMVVRIKIGLVNTNNAAPFIVIMPTSYLDKLPKGSYRWISEMEYAEIQMNILPKSLLHRCINKGGMPERKEEFYRFKGNKGDWRVVEKEAVIEVVNDPLDKTLKIGYNIGMERTKGLISRLKTKVLTKPLISEQGEQDEPN